MAVELWTLAVTKPRQEAKAADNCRQQGLDVVLPRLRTVIVIRGRVINRDSYLFPSYLFVAFEDDHVYGILRDTRGVARVLLMAGRPATCSAEVMQAVIDRMDVDGYVELPKVEPPPAANYRIGQRVRVSDPSHVMFGHRGLYQGMDARQRVKVLMSLMGRKVPVQLEHSALAAA